ncbi:hypothetical protein DPMN_157286 [Dreissena polymorpha]|uniref:Endonuclease/exonuclease/phosphatase domain-containing protein n=1 Tax=Dreissena polymorpha TaxID=45954 RepID=A0A9D4EGY2_DREPO|nr:hypothetical protein DPMN_157286 [Dreissena polymorpha]
MNILTKERCLVPYSTFSKDSQAAIISVLNVRSLPNHSADVLKDPSFLMSDVIVLTETWLSENIASCTLLPNVLRPIAKEVLAMPYQMTIMTSTTPQIDITAQIPLLQQIEAMLVTIPHNEPCMILGDMNEDALATTHGPIQTALKSLHFQQVVQSPTHRFGACLDHIYTRNIDCMDTCVSATYYSDHDWASCNFKF